MRFIYAVATLVGATLGAGVLGLPYAMMMTGFFSGVLLLFFVACLIVITHLYLAEILDTSKTNHQVSGLVQMYLGKKIGFIFTLFLVLLLTSALIAYGLGFGSLLYSLFGLPSYVASLLAYAILSVLLFFRLRFFARIELLLTGFLLGLVLLISFSLLSSFSFYTSSSPPSFLVPYGIILFALMGGTSLPEVRRELGSDPKRITSVILVSMLVCFFVYALLSVSVVGVTQHATSDVFALGLTGFVKILGLVLSFVCLTTAFLAVGYAVKDVYFLDFHFSNNKSWLFALLPAFLFLLVKPTTFISMLSFTGAIGGGIFLLVIIWLHTHVVTRSQLGFLRFLFVKLFLSLFLVIGIIASAFF